VNVGGSGHVAFHSESWAPKNRREKFFNGYRNFAVGPIFAACRATFGFARCVTLVTLVLFKLGGHRVESRRIPIYSLFAILERQGEFQARRPTLYALVSDGFWGVAGVGSPGQQISTIDQ
jgi:hypothetical protein